MEEPVHYLVLLLLQFDGTLVKEVLEFARPMTLLECGDFADVHREAIAIYNDKLNAWLLKDGSGTWQGNICIQDIDKL